ncbi:hypothetical protein ROS1_28620 [Roseibium sp. ROS1]
MNIITRLFGDKQKTAADKLSVAKARVLELENLIVQNKIVRDSIADQIIDAEIAIGLGEGSSATVTKLRAEQADLESEIRGAEAVLTSICDAIPGLQEAAEQEAADAERQAGIKAALAGQRTLQKRLDTALQAQAALEQALDALADAPEAARMIRAGRFTDRDISERAQEELDARTQGITLAQLRVMEEQAETKAAINAGRFQAVGLEQRNADLHRIASAGHGDALSVSQIGEIQPSKVWCREAPGHDGFAGAWVDAETAAKYEQNAS